MITPTTIKLNPIQLLWEEHRADVDKELETMLGPDWDSQKAFEKRTTACKQVLDRMTERERANFDAKLQARRLQGNPINVQCT